MLLSIDRKYIPGEDTEVCDTPNELVVSDETRSDNIHETERRYTIHVCPFRELFRWSGN